MATYDTNINQFKPGKAVGDLDIGYFGGENVVSCRFNPDSVGTLVAGQGVKLVDLGASDVAGPPIVDVRTAETDTIFGVVKRSLKTATFSPGDTVEIAINDAVMFLRAASNYNRGAKLSLVAATPGSVQAQGTKAYVGYALDKLVSGQLGRVMLKPDAVTAGTT